MTVREAINWLQLFAEPDVPLTIDVYFPDDEWPHNKEVKSFRNEMKRKLDVGDGMTGHTVRKVVMRYE
jgi:hypothetical protein